MMEARELALLIAISTDERKAARLAEIQEAEKALEARNGEAEAILAKAQEERAAAVHEQESFDATLAEFEAEKDAFRKMQADLAAEKHAWSEVREQVDAQQKERGAALDQREAHVAEREAAIGTHEAEADRKLTEANALQADYEAKHKRLEDAMAANLPGV